MLKHTQNFFLFNHISYLESLQIGHVPQENLWRQLKQVVMGWMPFLSHDYSVKVLNGRESTDSSKRKNHAMYLIFLDQLTEEERDVATQRQYPEGMQLMKGATLLKDTTQL